jgi:hypothetical protein
MFYRAGMAGVKRKIRSGKPSAPALAMLLDPDRLIGRPWPMIAPPADEPVSRCERLGQLAKEAVMPLILIDTILPCHMPAPSGRFAVPTIWAFGAGWAN